MNKLLATILAGAITCSTDVFSLPIECASLDKLLPSKTWFYAGTGNNHVFNRTSAWEGQWKLAGTYIANYQLSFRYLKASDTPEGMERQICLISFTYLDGDCFGDVHTWVVETIGDGLRFRTAYSNGDHRWDFSNESSATSCDMDGYLILPR